MPQILVIDDDSTMRVLVTMVLQKQGYEVIQAIDGEQGLKKARASEPALIICDWMMPGMDGLEVCRQIKADSAFSSTFFILLTAREEIADRIQGLDTGADEFLTKPIDASELQSRVRAGLRLYQSNQELKKLAQDLQHQKQRLETELAEAAAYVQSLLPNSFTFSDHGISIQSCFIPSKQLGGDLFDYHWIDEHYLRIYLLDVSGHGLRSALLSVSLCNFLKSVSLGQKHIDLYNPAEVLKFLNRGFQMQNHSRQFFTIWYGVYNCQTRELTYSNAGHPPAVLISHSESKIGSEKSLECETLQTLNAIDIPVGMMPDVEFTTQSCQIAPHSTLYIFSDGVYEIPLPDRTIWGFSNFVSLLEELHKQPHFPLNVLVDRVMNIGHSKQFEDDFSLLKVQFD